MTEKDRQSLRWNPADLFKENAGKAVKQGASRGQGNHQKLGNQGEIIPTKLPSIHKVYLFSTKFDVLK